MTDPSEPGGRRTTRPWPCRPRPTGSSWSTSCGAPCRSSGRSTSAGRPTASASTWRSACPRPTRTEGHAIGYTRGLPLDAMVGMLAGGVLGGARRRSPGASWTAWSPRTSTRSARSGVRSRLLEIALADAAGPQRGPAALAPPRRGPVARPADGRGRLSRGRARCRRRRRRGPRRCWTRASGRVKLHTADAAIVARVRRACGDDVGLGGRRRAWRGDRCPRRSRAARPSTSSASRSSRIPSRLTAGG